MKKRTVAMGEKQKTTTKMMNRHGSGHESSSNKSQAPGD